MWVKVAGTSLALSVLAFAPSFAFDLSEQLLGVSPVPFTVGQVVAANDLAAQHCPEAENGLVVCPIVGSTGRGIGVILEKAADQQRVASVFSYTKCDPARCAEEREKSVVAMTKRLGAKPENLDGNPIWHDRQKHQRDLIITMIGSDMLATVLVESK